MNQAHKSSINDFKNLEDKVSQQNRTSYSNPYLGRNKNQKLFEDESDEEENKEDNRSTLVKKMFYRDTQKDSLRGKNEENSGQIPETVQRLLDDKKEQLDKAMKHYN